MRLAILSSLGLALVAFSIAWFSVDPTWFTAGDDTEVASALFPTTYLGIVARNLGGALLLFSGLLTLGLSTVFATLGLWFYLGIAMKVAASNAGASALFNQVWLYSIPEFAAFLVAGTAGLLPVATVCSHRSSASRPTPMWQIYAASVPRSLTLIALAAALLCLAAWAEMQVL